MKITLGRDGQYEFCLETEMERASSRQAVESGSRLFNLEHYYASFRNFIRRCGSYASVVKLAANADAGVPDVVNVKQEYYGKNGNADVNIESTIARRNRVRELAADDLDYWSKRVGYPPMSTDDKRFLMEFLMSNEHRTELSKRIRKNTKNQVLQSAKELIIEIVRPQRKSPR